MQCRSLPNRFRKMLRALSHGSFCNRCKLPHSTPLEGNLPKVTFSSSFDIFEMNGTPTTALGMLSASSCSVRIKAADNFSSTTATALNNMLFKHLWEASSSLKAEVVSSNGFTLEQYNNRTLVCQRNSFS
mmetsp:Transcript_35476/g.58774  ORF Transcript_35476/g.58774 Transcript_35476/m.58774 type:complete len:130 (+) Transcript_35476:248-637(+)